MRFERVCNAFGKSENGLFLEEMWGCMPIIPNLEDAYAQ